MEISYTLAVSLVVFLAVVCSSLFQSWWNFHLKKVDTDKTVFLAVSWLFFGILMTPLSLLIEGWPRDIGWWPFLATGLIHGVYLLVLSWTYTIADISFVFPMARGVSIVLTTLMIAAFGIYQPTLVGYVGIAIVIVGALTLGSLEFRLQKHQGNLLWVLLLAMIVATYTVIDSQAAKEVPLLLYLALMNLIASLVVMPFLVTSSRRELVRVLRFYKLQALMVGLAGSAGYLIIIWAYKQAPAPYVAALREISIVMATLLGIYYLKERFYFRKALGIAFILAGIVVLKTL